MKPNTLATDYAMNTKSLYVLLHLLRLYRAALTWTTSTPDIYRQHVDRVIHDVRQALDRGGFYDHPSMRVKP